MAEPTGVLGRIGAAKREEVRRRFDGVALDALRSAAVSTDKSLAAAVGTTGSRFILEIKKASPSAGAIRADADPAMLARHYAGVADALSVLCDGPFFGGSLADLTAARAEFEGPILAKDFFIDVRQVGEARLAGADAILVMLSLLDDQDARAMMAEARRFGMEALVEVHDEGEMRRAIALGAPLIGINNRDLRDLSIDLGTTERLAPMAPNRTLVSESGISTRADVDRLAPLVDGFLVGSSLMKAEAPAQAARDLVFGRTKLCGLRCGGDVAAGRPAAFAGFVFAAGSPRLVTADEAAPLAGLARAQGQQAVGVFRGNPRDEIVTLAKELALDAVQVHGHVDPELRTSLPPGCELWTALDVGRDDFLAAGGDRLLFDNGPGGSGQPFDWPLVRDHPRLATSLIAGGLGPHNAAAARALGAYAIDVGSALDETPGRKSAQKIAGLFDALRTPGRQEVRACA